MGRPYNVETRDGRRWHCVIFEQGDELRGERAAILAHRHVAGYEPIECMSGDGVTVTVFKMPGGRPGESEGEEVRDLLEQELAHRAEEGDPT